MFPIRSYPGDPLRVSNSITDYEMSSCFVRARRLNVIIQPHLRFVYELMKWDEQQQAKRGLAINRELDWPVVAREIAAMNRPYSRN